MTVSELRRILARYDGRTDVVFVGSEFTHEARHVYLLSRDKIDNPGHALPYPESTAPQVLVIAGD